MLVRDPLGESERSLPNRVTSPHEMSAMHCQEYISLSFSKSKYSGRFDYNKIQFSLQEQNIFIFIINF